MARDLAKEGTVVVPFLMESLGKKKWLMLKSFIFHNSSFPALSK